MTLSAEQLNALAIVERCASALSILGILTIIGTFGFSRQFRNPVHRLIFINAFYNLFDVTATFISLSGPAAGNHSALCQFQGFLLQMFPLADVFWTFAMALDVFLIVFFKYEAADLRKLEMKYIIGITSVVFIPALTFLFVHTPQKGYMYGSVTLWCAIAPKWVMYRIIFYYGPIWLTIFTITILYGLVGIEILKQRHVFKSISNDFVGLDTMASTSDNLHPNHINNTEVNIELPPELDASVLQDNKGAGSVSLSKSIGSSRLSPSDGVALANAPRSRSPVSFRQYILLPLMFFVVLLTIWVAPTTNRVASLINPNYQSYPLLLAVGATGSLRGFWNGVVFVTLGLKERTRQARIKKGRG